jgi:hypothetical protein
MMPAFATGAGEDEQAVANERALHSVDYHGRRHDAAMVCHCGRILGGEGGHISAEPDGGAGSWLYNFPTSGLDLH